MPAKRLDYSAHARRDLEAMEAYHLTRYPYTLVYRIGSRRVEIVRVIHQRSEYFQRRR